MSDPITVSSGVTSSGVRLTSRQELVVLSGGKANYTLVGFKANETLSGGSSSATKIIHQGYEYVFGDGAPSTAGSYDTLIERYGTEIVASGGHAFQSIVDANGLLEVDGGATRNADVRGTERVGGGIVSGSSQSGLSSNTKVVAGGVEEIAEGGIARDTDVQSGGRFLISNGGKADGTRLSKDIDAEIYAGGTAVATAVTNGGYLVVNSGGTADATSLASGTFLLVSSGGKANATSVGSGGDLVVLPGASASDSKVVSGGHVISSGVFGISANHVETYGKSASGLDAESLYVISGGTAVATNLIDGQMTVFKGTAISTTVGVATIYLESGTTTASMIFSDGEELVSSGGVAYDSVIKKNAAQIVNAGGVATNTTIALGTLTVEDGGAASGTITFTGKTGVFTKSGGVLNLDGGLTGAVISGFAQPDKIDLGFLSYNDNDYVTVATAGIVTIVTPDGDENLNIAGAKVGETDFRVQADPVLGTLLTRGAAAFLRPATAGNEAPALPDLAAAAAGRYPQTATAANHTNLPAQSSASWVDLLTKTVPDATIRLAVASHTAM